MFDIIVINKQRDYIITMCVKDNQVIKFLQKTYDSMPSATISNKTKEDVKLVTSCTFIALGCIGLVAAFFIFHNSSLTFGSIAIPSSVSIIIGYKIFDKWKKDCLQNKNSSFHPQQQQSSINAILLTDADMEKAISNLRNSY